MKITVKQLKQLIKEEIMNSTSRKNKKIATIWCNFDGREVVVDDESYNIHDLTMEKLCKKYNMILDEVEASNDIDDQEMTQTENSVEQQILKDHGVTHVKCDEVSPELMTLSQYIQVGIGDWPTDLPGNTY